MRKISHMIFVITLPYAVYHCFTYYKKWSHIPCRTIKASVSAYGYLSTNSYCNFRIMVDAANKDVNPNVSADNIVEISNCSLYDRRIDLADSFYDKFNVICLANEDYLSNMLSFYVLDYECSTTIHSKLPPRPNKEILYSECSDSFVNYASNPVWRKDSIGASSIGNGFLAFARNEGSGNIKFNTNLFNMRPHMKAKWDITQSNFIINIDCNDVKCDTISVEFFGATDFSEMYPKPDYLDMSRIEFTDSTKIKEIISKGLRFHADFIQLRELSAMRIFILTFVLSLVLSLIGNYIFKWLSL